MNVNQGQATLCLTLAEMKMILFSLEFRHRIGIMSFMVSDSYSNIEKVEWIFKLANEMGELVRTVDQDDWIITATAAQYEAISAVVLDMRDSEMIQLSDPDLVTYFASDSQRKILAKKFQDAFIIPEETRLF